MTALTAAQVSGRRHGIGGSDAAQICSGSWLPLWNIKTGRGQRADLSRILAVQMGHATEEFNAHWYEQTTGHRVTERGRRVVNAAHPHMRCHLDGVVATLGAVWEGKHVNAGSSAEEVVREYMAQVQHEMICRGLDRAVLSIIIGTTKYAAVMVDRDEDFAAAYVARCDEFWRYVTAGTPPPASVPRLVFGSVAIRSAPAAVAQTARDPFITMQMRAALNNGVPR